MKLPCETLRKWNAVSVKNQVAYYAMAKAHYEKYCKYMGGTHHSWNALTNEARIAMALAWSDFVTIFDC